MNISCAFAPSLETPDHIALAEQLGYGRAFVYDSPALYADPWMVLALAAARTERIGLGPAVLVPSLRHPLVNAAAIATLAGLAPGRTVAAFGTGLTGRMLLGQRPLKWSDVAAYVAAVRALLKGDEVSWEGSTLRLLGDRAPVDAQLLLAADGPKGLGLADELADGVLSTGAPREPDGRERTVLSFGTVLDEGEEATNERVRRAAAPAVAAAFHSIYESRGPEGVQRLPGGPEWAAAVEQIDAHRRHLSVHDGHLVALNPLDAAIADSTAALIPKWTLTGTASDVRARLDKLAGQGVTEIAYQPIGDIPRELRRFIEAAQS